VLDFRLLLPEIYPLGVDNFLIEQIVVLEELLCPPDHIVRTHLSCIYLIALILELPVELCRLPQVQRHLNLLFPLQSLLDFNEFTVSLSL